MGNIISNYRKNEENMNDETLIEYIDIIASKYILTQSIMDMVRFTDKEYYDNMIVLTSYILKTQLGSIDLSLLKERILNGNTIKTNNQNNNQNNNETNIIYYSNAEKLKKISKMNEKQKQKILLLISKFYIKIMTIFSAITSIIDPQYVYEDEDGIKQYFFLKDFETYASKIDLNTNKLKINQLDNPISFVNKRLNILKNKLSKSNENNDKFIVLNPGEKFCEKQDNNILYDEVGIKELDLLYYDVYDYEENKWNKKSENMQKKYACCWILMMLLHA